MPLRHGLARPSREVVAKAPRPAHQQEHRRVALRVTLGKGLQCRWMLCRTAVRDCRGAERAGNYTGTISRTMQRKPM